MKRGGGSAGRPYWDFSIEQLEAQVKEVRELNDIKALRAELQFRKSKRAKELDDLLARLHRFWTDKLERDTS